MAKETKKGTIAIIDDEYTITKVVAQTLKNQKYQTTTYTDGQEAIEGFKEILGGGNTPDISVILSDIRMPNKGGLETVEEILKLYRHMNKNKPEILFMNGYCNTLEEEKVNEISNYSILEKPFSVKSLVEAVNTANDNFYKRV